MNINVLNTSHQLPTIEEKLDSIVSIIESWNINAIGLASKVINDIKKQVENISEISLEVSRAIDEISQQLSSLIPDEW